MPATVSRRGTTTAARNGTSRPRGARVAPPGESRQQVLQWLAANGGEIVDSSGRATPKLLEAVGYQGGMTGFGALLTAMTRDGEIVRDLRGRRCSRIALPAAPRKAVAVKASPPAAKQPTTPVAKMSAAPTVDGDNDYTEVALALLNTVVDIVSAGGIPADTAGVETENADLKTENTRLQAENARLQAENARLLQERNFTLDRFRTVRNQTSADVQAISRFARG